MKRILPLLVFLSLLITSCGDSKEDRIEKETAKILVTYNGAISKHKINVEETKRSSRVLGLSNMQMEMLYGSDWQQRGWDTLRTYYKIDSLETAFKDTFGEDEFNVLQLKVDSNWNEKMN